MEQLIFGCGHILKGKPNAKAHDSIQSLKNAILRVWDRITTDSLCMCRSCVLKRFRKVLDAA